MIHEVLLALLGHTGGLVIETEEGFVLSSAADFLTEGERRLLEQSLKAGFLCKRLSEFTAAVRRRHFSGDAEGPEVSGSKPGHYTYGFAQRVEETLDAYRACIVDLEAQILREPSLPLSYIATSVESNCRVLSVLHRIVVRAMAKNVAGGPLLDLLWNAAACHMGAGGVYSCLWSAVAGAGQVLANQLVAWMVYGRLVDPDGEFFVRRVWDKQLVWRPGAALYGGDADDFAKEIDAASAQREWQSLFALRPEAIPSTIMSLETAEKALFVGKAVRVLLRSNRWLRRSEDSWEAAAQGHLDPPSVQNEVDTLRSCFEAKSPAYVVEQSVERIRVGAAAQLRQLVVEEAELCQHFAALKGFYLLGYGAFYQTLLEVSRPLLRRRPPAHAEQELSFGPWAAALAEHEAGAESLGLGAGGGSLPSTPAASSSRRVPLERLLASRFEIRFVPRSFELQSFADAARQVKLVGMARLVGGQAELGAQGAGSSGASQTAMLWLTNKLRLSQSFQHAFSFQVHSPPPPGATALVPGALPEFGSRFALCFQPHWAPGDIQKWRHTMGAAREGGSERLSAAHGAPGSGQGAYWTALGECLALEVEYCVLPHRASVAPVAEVTLSLLLCHPGLAGEGRDSSAPSPAVQRLATASLKTPAPPKMVHLVRLWHDAGQRQLQVFFGADAVAPACTAQLDLGATMSLELGCAYAGFCLLPLDFQHRLVGATAAAVEEVPYSSRDRPVSIVSWRHGPRSSAKVAAAADADGALESEDPGSSSSTWFVGLGLSYKVPWPLPLVITQNCLERYNRLFRLLLAFRHAHLELQHVELPRNDLLAWALRSELSFFVSQVLQYFQQDVIEAAHKRLLDLVDKSSSFDDVTGAHEDFLTTLTTHCFLKAPELHQELMAALRIASVFVQSAAVAGAPGSQEASSLGLRRLQGDFVATVRSVLRMMASMNRQGHGMHTHLSQLLLRLDYNGYFSGEVEA